MGVYCVYKFTGETLTTILITIRLYALILQTDYYRNESCNFGMVDNIQGLTMDRRLEKDNSETVGFKN